MLPSCTAATPGKPRGSAPMHRSTIGSALDARLCLQFGPEPVTSTSQPSKHRLSVPLAPSQVGGPCHWLDLAIGVRFLQPDPDPDPDLDLNQGGRRRVHVCSHEREAHAPGAVRGRPALFAQALRASVRLRRCEPRGQSSGPRQWVQHPILGC